MSNNEIRKNLKVLLAMAEDAAAAGAGPDRHL